MTKESSVSVPRYCPECGSDTYAAQDYNKLSNRLYRLEQKMIRDARESAESKARLEWELLKAKGALPSLQSKVARQRTIINQLEKKLRDNGIRPYTKEVENKNAIEAIFNQGLDGKES